MTLPSLFIGLVLSTIFGAGFHLWRGGGAGRLLLYLILGWVGFWVGHFAGDALGLTFGSLGPLRAGAASAGAILFLIAGHWLSLVEVERRA
jgi:hypothetical protein